VSVHTVVDAAADAPATAVEDAPANAAAVAPVIAPADAPSPPPPPLPSSSPPPLPSPWIDATLAAALLAVDPAGLGGVALRAPPGPVRDQWLALLRGLLGDGVPLRRLPLHIREDRLLGGLDLAATLQAGRPVAQRGLLAECDGGVVLVAMAERLPAATAAHLTAVLDRHEVVLERDGIALRQPTCFGVVALDEGIDRDEQLSAPLADRLAFHVDLTDVSPRDAFEAGADAPDAAADIARARALMPAVVLPEALLQALCAASVALGVASLRPSLLALKVARCHAALRGSGEVDADDAGVAVRLVLAPRATLLPQAAPPEEDQADGAAEPPPPEPPADGNEDAPPPDQPLPEGALDDIVLQAALAALPPGLLARLKAQQAAQRAGRAAGKAGALQKSGRRGRPSGVRRGEPRGGQRLNVIETLRAAAPWQTLRRRLAPPAGRAPGGRIEVRSEDFHVTRHRQRRETTTIFVVDASGSAALARLAEAKGAVELLLADCYIRRDRVAVLAFRGRGAELLLPPTRSLVRAKRCLAGLPGGGGTPLAAAIDAAAALADAVARRGDTPVIVLLTDGRANVALDGTGGRARAEADAFGARAAAARARQRGAADRHFGATAAAGRAAGHRVAWHLSAAAVCRRGRAVAGGAFGQRAGRRAPLKRWPGGSTGPPTAPAGRSASTAASSTPAVCAGISSRRRLRRYRRSAIGRRRLR
jgi:magnesium chelatase subunit D